MEEPEVGSVWEHHSGRIYVVLFLVNEPNSDKPDYPRTVIYRGPNGKLWSGRLDDWHRRMRRHPAA
jgi:hypothetical protein